MHHTKNRLDGIDSRRIRDARAKCNPCELIRTEGFQNRAALKLAEIDACTQWKVTRPDSFYHRLDRPHTLTNLQAMDLCGGPGGFSEYLIWKTRKQCRIIGSTLRGPIDFKTKFLDTRCFRSYYGEDETGNILHPNNMQALVTVARQQTHGFGMDVVVADGGMSVKGQENQQETLCFPLIMCQCAVALASLAYGGVFVCKVFDVFTPEMKTWLRLLFLYFERATLLKTNQSRPANSERYVICQGFKRNTLLFPHLYLPKTRLPWLTHYWYARQSSSSSSKHQVPTIPQDIQTYVQQDFKSWSHYMEQHIQEVVTRQIQHLERLFTYIEDQNQPPNQKQEDVRRQCLAAWHIPCL